MKVFRKNLEVEVLMIYVCFYIIKTYFLTFAKLLVVIGLSLESYFRNIYY